MCEVNMKTLAAVALLQLCFCATVSVNTSSAETTPVTAEPGDVALLPCYTGGTVTPSVTLWLKDGREVIKGGGAAADTRQRLTVLSDGSLNIRGVIPGDEGTYLCNSTLPDNTSYGAGVLLQVFGGPENVSAFIGPATALQNGTLIAYRGSTVNLNCSGSSYPSQELTWTFSGDLTSNKTLASTSASQLPFTIDDIQPDQQGNYTCTAHNTASHQTVNKSTQLLVYYCPDRHPECTWDVQDSTHVRFSCTWLGAYPPPSLRWGVDDDGGGDQGGHWKGHVYTSDTSDSLSVSLNRSVLSDGQTLRCMARHQALAPGKEKEKSCSFTLKPPFPVGEPLATAQEATSITLTCTEDTSTPPANTTWRRGLKQEDIVAGSKYVVSEEGPIHKLTILNITKDDEGVYFCRSENPLAIQELEVYLTVRTSSAYTGAILGVFIAALIVGSAAVVAKTIYSSRHRICLGSGFGSVEDDRGDVLSLVESDDEQQIFQDTVPRLPPVTNGRHTTLVQIHRIPSSDHEDAETADASTEPQDEAAQTEEPEDLVTF